MFVGILVQLHQLWKREDIFAQGFMPMNQSDVDKASGLNENT